MGVYNFAVIQAKGGQRGLDESASAATSVITHGLPANSAVSDRKRVASGGDDVRVDFGNHDTKRGLVATTGRLFNHFVPAGQNQASTLDRPRNHFAALPQSKMQSNNFPPLCLNFI